MRPIKLRAWDKDLNRMLSIEQIHEWLTFNGDYREKSAFIDSKGKETIGQRFILMQFTGLHDKNGKEGFHHDLVRDEEGLLWEIEWGEGRFYFVSREKDVRPDGNIAFMDCITIVGNIYEDPKLLEGK